MAAVSQEEHEQAWDTRPLASKEAVRAFYHMNDHPTGFRYLRLLNSSPEVSPETVAKIGLSTGWIPATVAEAWNPEQAASSPDDRVLVKLHGHFGDVYNVDAQPVNGMYWRVKRSLVRPMGVSQAKLDVSLLVVRWWDYWNRQNRRSRTHNVANEEMLLDVLEGPHSPHEAFGEHGNYEIHTAFVRNEADLEAMGASLAQAMRGQRKAGLYFLWPTQRPARHAGCVPEPPFFAVMERMENLGVRTCWPHGRHLYRELAGKLWVPRVSRGRPELRVAPTVKVDMARWQADPEAAVEELITDLKGMGDQSRSGIDSASYRGVAKLGFSWMGEDVLPFTGPKDLLKVLSQHLENSTPETVCLVQQRVEDVTCELRLVCCRDLANGPEAVKMEIVRMRLKPPRHNDQTFSLTGAITMSKEEATQVAFRGNVEMMEEAEREVFRLGHLWLAWLRDEGYGVPSSCRLDFLVTVPKGAARPEVWTVELCENGGSLCGLTHHARTAATLNECCATGAVAFEYSLEEHQSSPLLQHLNNMRQVHQVSEQDWQKGLNVLDSTGAPVQELASLSESCFPVNVKYKDSTAMQPKPLPALVLHKPETGVAAPALGGHSSSSKSSGGGTLAKWLRANSSKTSFVLVLLGLIFFRLSRRR
jgi:hypothetical protein